jgi:hypothetical protein
VAGSSYEGEQFMDSSASMAAGVEAQQAVSWRFSGFGSGQWLASREVVTESPGGVFVVGDRLEFLSSSYRSLVVGLFGGRHCLLA